MDGEPLRVGLLGGGTVGSQVARLILEHGDDLAARIGRPLELVGIVVRNLDRPRPGLPASLLTTDAEGLVTREGIDIAIELIGGIDPAQDLILKAMSHGASVVTANKALLAAKGDELFGAAQHAGVDLYYEAAVAGAIPIVRPLSESLVGDEIQVVMGIVNGTTNYILDKMTAEGMDYQTALVQAQDLGYAEADPTADVEGHDAAAKAALLASLAFHTRVRGDQVHREGITGVAPQDIRAARGLGCVVKLLAVAKLLDDGQISVRVHPAMVPNTHPLASVKGAYNAIFVEAAAAGRLMFLGPGAGGAPTASAVVGDLVTVARNRSRGVVGPVQPMYNDHEVAPMGLVTTRYFVRLRVQDEPGVLAGVAGVFARHHISVQDVQQTPAGGKAGDASAELYLLTHEAKEADLLECVADLQASPQVQAAVRFMRVEGM
ncbi:homoserine dehydrogenase [Brooklawnia cerclae]|uniref:Homoserine dehydrogenase n=1 Tax=Brooklawnia cerclae TaxID=349934 RepID=A0ABX0SGT8_9ACTN|nr:homoserine dehydrogenase [Brooklawnia cerclae]NIH56415.1 homoserine dehydrogenase [Brooklawnia cerclae]